ncbi:hypothetical protein ABZ671_18325 [Micromonospora sp. NPDC006766]|uniref:hypothetical protein n=1 Tax=Micromonospora sp. NPDC006766 TaxID=3154778 RepID=UPI0033D2FF69
METWRVLAGFLIPLVMTLVGVVLATNFRGAAEWHMRQSMSAASVLRRVPPWRLLPDPDHDRRLARFVLLDRALGVLFTAAGPILLVFHCYLIFTDEQAFSHR